MQKKENQYEGMIPKSLLIHFYPELQSFPFDAENIINSFQYCPLLIQKAILNQSTEIFEIWNSLFNLENDENLSDFQTIMKIMNFEDFKIIWLNEFGCALVMQFLDISENESILSPYILYPDAWKTIICYGKFTMHISVPTKFGQSFCTIFENRFEQIEATDFELFFSEFLNLASETKRKSKAKTPKTPFFIHQILRLTIKWFNYKSQKHPESKEKSMEEFFNSERIINGEGMADLSLCELSSGKKNGPITSWPILLNVVQHILEKNEKTHEAPELLIQKFRLVVHILQIKEAYLTPIFSPSSEKAAFLVEILLQNFIEDFFSVNKKLINLKIENLNQIIKEYKKQLQKVYTPLIEEKIDEEDNKDFFFQKFRTIDLDSRPSIQNSSLGEITLENYSENWKIDLPDIWGLIPSEPKVSITNWIHKMELTIWNAAHFFLKNTNQILTLNHVANLLKIVSNFNDQTEEILKSLAVIHSERWVLVVERKSHAVLAYHIALCVAYRHLTEKHPLLMQNYKLPIQAKTLRRSFSSMSLVAHEACNIVREYLKDIEKKKEKVLFSPVSNWKDTIEFVANFPPKKDMNDYQIEDLKWLQLQIQNREIEIKEHYKKIEKANQEKDQLEEKYNLAHSEMQKNNNYWNEYLKNQALKNLETCKDTIKTLENKTFSSIQPNLPKNSSEAHIILFFLFLPIEFCHVAKSISNIEKLFGKEKYDFGHNKVLWKNGRKTGKGPSFPMNEQNAYTNNKFPNGQTFSYRFEASYHVTYPFYDLQFERGAVKMEIEKEILEQYTEKIEDVKKLGVQQWMMIHPIKPQKPCDRGNIVYAKMQERVLEITPQAFIQIGSLRSYPHLQLLKIAAIIEDPKAPIENTSVRRLLFQTFAHAINSSLVFQDSIIYFIESIKKAIKITPPMLASRLSIFASFLSLISTREADLLAMECAEFLLFFRTCITEGITLNSEIMARSCIMCGWIIICFRNKRNIDLHEARIFLEAIVRYRMDSHYVPNTAWESLKNGMEHLIQMSVFDVLDKVNEIVNESRFLMTEMVKIVFEDNVNIIWERKNSYWWEGKSAFKIYHINIQIGIVMCNGSERRRLPTNLTNTDDYKQIFAEGTTFEVMEEEKNIRFRTTQSYCNKKFDFYINGRIDMIDLESGLNLRLLPVKPFEVFGLPNASLECRHWIDDNNGTIFFTEPKINPLISFNVKFIFLGKENDGYRKVPQQHQLISLKEILEKAHDFEILGSLTKENLISPLFRIESKEFIHVLLTKDNQIVLDLPRLLLKFFLCSNGLLHSSEFEGYIVSKNQNYFQHISSSLLMHLTPEYDNPEKPKEIVLLLVNSNRILFKYDVHRRFGFLEGATRESRWFLAAQLAKYETGSILPQWGVSPLDMCSRLIRHCASNQPLNDLEVACVQEIIRASYKQPYLALVAYAIEKFSRLVNFLPFESKSNNYSFDQISKIEDAYSIYKTKALQGFIHPRRFLKPVEINLIFGKDEKSSYYNATTNIHEFIPKIEEKNWDEIYNIKFVENELLKKFVSREAKEKDNLVNPEAFLKGKNLKKLEDEIELELKDSLKKYEQIEVYKLTAKIEDIIEFCEANIKIIEKIQIEISDFFSKFEESLTKDTHQSLHLLGSHRCTSVEMDRLEFIFDLEAIRRFYKLPQEKSSAICREVNKASIYYGTLCVLDDKLKRIKWGCQKLMKNNNDPYWKESVLNNILSQRLWDPFKKPYWLVYEIEQRIQIRPAQYRIASFLIEHPNRSTQLNMGLGKTRVIIPMIILHFIFEEHPKTLLKIHTLFAILKETGTHLSKTLTSSSLNIFHCEIPFHRDVELNEKQIKMFQQFIQILKRKDVNSFIIVAREHSQSLILKGSEFSLKNKVLTEDVVKLFELNPAINIIDESDAFLQHSIKLMYAVGSPKPLPDGEIRWWVAHRLLTAISRLVEKDLAPPEIIVVSAKNGSQPKVEITNQNCDDINKMLNFRIILLRQFLEDPPREMTNETVERIKSSKDKDEIINFMVNEESKYGKHIFDNWPKRDIKFILAIRGFLARGILETCLTRRHLVNYGVDLKRLPIRRVAIPFDAANVPSLRSEFAHPDVTILFSLLSYFYTGLNREEFDLSLKVLTKQGPSVQLYYYNRWVKKRPEIIKSLKEALPFDATDVNSLDLSNKALTDVLFSLLKYDIEIIGFFVALEIFPSETQQYNESICATAWDCVDVPFPLGLSGTNDTHRLLPLPLRHQNADDEIAGTNGMMLFCIINRTNPNLIVRKYEDQVIKISGWEVVIDVAIQSKCNVVIDAGALLVGAPPDKICSFIAKQSLGTVKAIIYFHKTEWMVYDCRTNAHIPKIRSSIHESKAEIFVIFDQAHCRGADLKLHPNAQGLLTLCTGMTKDVFMQAAGRLRQLEISQSLVLFSFPDVKDEILRSISRMKIVENEIDIVKVQDVLQWTLINTSRLNEKGIATWINQGMQHASIQTTKSAKLRLLIQNWALNIYLPAVEMIDFKNKFESLKHFYENKLKSHFGNNEFMNFNFSETIKVLYLRPMHFAMDIRMLTVDDNIEFCEREIEQEEEELNEKELEIQNLKPYEEIPLSAEKILDKNRKKLSLEEIFEKGGVNYGFTFTSSDLVKATTNFFATVRQSKLDNETNTYFPYTRIVQFLWKTKENSVLLLSDLESDILYADFLKKKEKTQNFQNQINSFVPWFKANSLISNEKIRTYIKIYLGEVNFDQEEKKELVFVLKNCDLAKAEICIDYRSLRHTLMCSIYEKAIQEEESRREKYKK